MKELGKTLLRKDFHRQRGDRVVWWFTQLGILFDDLFDELMRACHSIIFGKLVFLSLEESIGRALQLMISCSALKLGCSLQPFRSRLSMIANATKYAKSFRGLDLSVYEIIAVFVYLIILFISLLCAYRLIMHILLSVCLDTRNISAEWIINWRLILSWFAGLAWYGLYKRCRLFWCGCCFLLLATWNNAGSYFAAHSSSFLDNNLMWL